LCKGRAILKGNRDELAGVLYSPEKVVFEDNDFNKMLSYRRETALQGAL